MGTPQYRPGGQSPIKPPRPVRRARQVAKHLKATQTAGTVTENQPARRHPTMTLSRYGRVAGYTRGSAVIRSRYWLRR